MKPILFLAALTLCFTSFSFLTPPHSKGGTAFPAKALSISADSTELRPVLLAKSEWDTSSSPLRMNELRVDVKVVGNIATTTMEMNFYNDLDRILEGQLVFPLNEGQTVSRFAMDVNGKLREGVIVEKQKGQQVFETIVRRNVDPGLLEWTRGNNFRARVYPIPAKGNKRILIAYEQELKTTPNGPIFLLPLDFPDVLDKFDLNVEVFQQLVSPKLQENELANMQFKQWKENYVAELHQTGVKADRQLGFTVPEPKKNAPVYLEKGADGDYYFYFRYAPKVRTQPKPAPKRITLLWDASSSGAKRDHARELALLEAVFAQYQNLQVDVVRFSVAAENQQITQVVNGNWGALRSVLEGIAYDGATQLGCLDLSKYETDEFYLFSDGISNFGEAEIKLGSKPVHCISSGPDAEYAVLRNFADQSGGAFISLRESEMKDALVLLSALPYRFLGLKTAAGAESVYPDRPTVVSSDFSMAGKLEGRSAQLELQFGIGEEVMETQKITIDAGGAEAESGMLPRIWAQKKLATLERDPKRNEKAIVELGKSHGLVTRFTSLIVLETLEDYLEFDIVPPEEMKAEFMARKNQVQMEEENEVKEHLALVQELWEKRKEWWNREIDWKKLKASVEKPSADSMVLVESTSGTGNREPVLLEESFATDSEETVSESEDWGGAGADAFESADDFGDDGGFDDVAEKMSEEDGEGKNRGREGKTSIKAWDPDEPYLKVMKAAPPANQYAVYLEQKAEFGNAPSFFLDCTDFFLDKGENTTALKVLSNIAEMQLEDYRLLRILGHRLLQLDLPGLAVPLFEQVLELRPEEPQSLRDLAHAYARAGRTQEAVDALWKIIQQPWDSRFPEIELIALEEMNALIATSKGKINTSHLDQSLVENLDLDLRVVLNWDANNCDMDLWVFDPLGEKCYYSHRETALGGWMSRDFTGGYGPEEFLLHKAMPGEYKVMVHYYGNQQQDLAGATTIQVQLISNFGRKDQKIQEVTRRLKGASEELEIGKVEF